MRRLLGGLLVTVLGLTGCTKESKPGGPGATGKTPDITPVERSYKAPDTSRTEQDTLVSKENTFTLLVPGTEKDLDRGERKEVKISIDRGDAFNQAVRLQFKAPEGLTVTPAEAVIKSGEKETNVTIEAVPDAPTGEVTIEVTGIPETGKSVSMQMQIEVHKD